MGQGRKDLLNMKFVIINNLYNKFTISYWIQWKAPQNKGAFDLHKHMVPNFRLKLRMKAHHEQCIYWRLLVLSKNDRTQNNLTLLAQHTILIKPQWHSHPNRYTFNSWMKRSIVDEWLKDVAYLCSLLWVYQPAPNIVCCRDCSWNRWGTGTWYGRCVAAWLPSKTAGSAHCTVWPRGRREGLGRPLKSGRGPDRWTCSPVNPCCRPSPRCPLQKG